MKNEHQDRKLELLVEEVELPDSAYDAAKRRYDDLGDWFKRESSTLRANDPHIFVQGSFALGTAIVPVKDGEEYDLDLTCKLRKLISRATHSQRQLKDIVGAELAAYRRARNIDYPLEAKNRCWRLKYKDELRFHMDIVPSVPEEDSNRAKLALLMEKRGMVHELATDIASAAVWITDQRKPTFNRISDDWPSSNPEGYVRWFVSRMRAPSSSVLMKEAQVDDVPLYRRKTPLQRAIQLLKTHRDVMFAELSDAKPVSIIITTIAGNAYVGGESLAESMVRILRALEDFRLSNSNEVLNPVNPAENFADKWHSPEYGHLRLKEQFHSWVIQVNSDFQFLFTAQDPKSLKKHAESTLKARVDEHALAALLPLGAPAVASTSPRRVIIESAPKPWGEK